eukprot:331749-Prorocentrum_lima.AAC.1
MGLLVVRKGHFVVHVPCPSLLPQVLKDLDALPAHRAHQPPDLASDIVHGLADTGHKILHMLTQA